MRLYKISALNTSQGGQPDSEVHWLGTQGECVLRRKQLAAEGWTRKEIDTLEVDVPTDKAGLLAFLNKLGDE